MAKPGRHLVMQMPIFLCLLACKKSISNEMNNNDNDLNLHSMTKLSGWPRYAIAFVFVKTKVAWDQGVHCALFGLTDSLCTLFDCD